MLKDGSRGKAEGKMEGSVNKQKSLQNMNLFSGQPRINSLKPLTQQKYASFLLCLFCGPKGKLSRIHSSIVSCTHLANRKAMRDTRGRVE